MFGLPPLAGRQVQGLWRNPFAYPVGAPLGFDPSHPASFGIGSGGSYAVTSQGALRLDYVLPGVNTGTISFSSGPIGPTLTGASGGNNDITFPQVGGTGNSLTVAAIFWVGGTTGTSFASLIGFASYALYAHGGTAPYGLNFYWNGSNNYLTPTNPIAANTPYFAAASRNVSGGIVNLVLVNLLTGQMQSWSSSAIGSVGAYSDVYLANDGVSDTLNTGGLARAMASSANVSLQELTAWAGDPWSFWHPLNVIARQSPVGTTPVVVTGQVHSRKFLHDVGGMMVS